MNSNRKTKTQKIPQFADERGGAATVLIIGGTTPVGDRHGGRDVLW